MNLNITLIVIVLLLNGLLATFLIINHADDKINQIFSKILIALLAAIVLIGLELLVKPPPIERKIKVLNLRYSDNTNMREFYNKLVKINSEFKNGYRLMSNTEVFNQENIKQLGDKYNPKQIGLDNLEYSIWTWLSEKYMIHWDIEQDYFEGISGGGTNTTISSNAEKKTMKLEYEALKKKLHSNQFLQVGCGQISSINFPENTSINVVEDSKTRRNYVIKNKYYQLSIEIYSIGTSGLTYTRLGENIKSSLKFLNKKWYSDRLIVKMKCEFSSFYKGSPKQKKQKKWISEIMDGLEHDFEWSNIKPELEKAYNQ